MLLLENRSSILPDTDEIFAFLEMLLNLALMLTRIMGNDGHTSTVNAHFTRTTASFHCQPASHSDHVVISFLNWSVLCVFYIFL